MKQRGLWIGFLSLFVLFVPSSFSGRQDAGEMYFGHISYIEPDREGKLPLVFRDGLAVPETAALNLPLGPGDIIQIFDGPRCEVQFDNGTIVRLDRTSKLKIETLLAGSLSAARKVSNLLLAEGQAYVMYKKYDSLEIFQVITPQAAVKMNHNAVALIQVTSERQTAIQVERGKANVLYGTDQFHILQKKVNARERLIVSGDPQNTVEPADYVAASDFQTWNELVNENFKAFHEESLLPKPVQNLPPAVFYFAQRYGSLYGEWIWHDLYGYVWRPYYNDTYPWGSWAPYFSGKWEVYRGQLFWIPGEPWGWVPYHLGIWMWDKNKGWIWMPGSMFAPAWAVWDFYSGYYAWRPWFLWDWMFLDGYFGSGSYWGFDGFPEYAVEPGTGFAPGVPPSKTLYTIRKDQLKRKSNPAFPLPKEMKKALDAAMNALKRGDENALASLRQVSRQPVYLKKSDFVYDGQGRIVGQDQMLKSPEGKFLHERPGTPPSQAAVSADALRAVHRRQFISDIQRLLDPATSDLFGRAPALARDFQFNPERTERPEARDVEREGGQAVHPRSADSAGRPSLRFRDWNPDIRAGIELGVDIRYDSSKNEVIAPQLGLRSGNAGHRMRLEEGQFRSPSSTENEEVAVEPGQSASAEGSKAGSQTRSEPSSREGGVKKKD